MPGNMLDAASPEDDAWGRKTKVAVIAMATVLVTYLGWYLHRHSDFSNDDLENFLLLRRVSFWKFVLTPTDVHFVPLHRFMSWFVYRVAPMNYALAIAILLAFHIGTLIVMARSLSLLRVGQFGGLIVCGYAASVLIIYGLAWWAHAEHRAPYVFFDVCAIYNYLAWMRNGKRVHLLFMASFFVMAFGIYEKAVFIPVHTLLVGYLSDERRFRSQWKKFLLPPLCGLLVSLIYVVSYLVLSKDAAHGAFLLSIFADREFAKAFFAAAFGISTEDVHDIPVHGMSLQLFCTVGLLAGAFFVSLWRGHGSWKIVLVAIGVVLLDNLPIVLSSHRILIVIGLSHQSRYGYEELHLLAILVGIWFYRIGLADLSGFRQQVTWSLGFAFVLVYAVINISYTRPALQHPSGILAIVNNSRRYLNNVEAGSAQITDKAPVFQNDRLPLCISVFRLIPDTKTLFPLLVPNARFDDKATPRYAVLQDGHIVQVH